MLRQFCRSSSCPSSSYNIVAALSFKQLFCPLLPMACVLFCFASLSIPAKKNNNKITYLYSMEKNYGIDLHVHALQLSNKFAPGNPSAKPSHSDECPSHSQWMRNEFNP